MLPVFLLISSCILFSILAALIKFGSQFIHPIEQAFFRNFIIVAKIEKSKHDEISKKIGNIFNLNYSLLQFIY